MENLVIWNQVKSVPAEAKKTISGGRLNGMTDISPMWRIKKLTELYGPCGIGWWYTIDKQWLEKTHNEEVSAFCNITLYTKDSAHGIPGTGGSAFIAAERKGPYVSDECFKMALTDALSVSCKALGIGADVYWEQGSKYDTAPDKPQKSGVEDKKEQAVPAKAKEAAVKQTPFQPQSTVSDKPKEVSKTDPAPQPKFICEECTLAVTDATVTVNGNDVLYTAEAIANSSKTKFGKVMCYKCAHKVAKK